MAGRAHHLRYLALIGVIVATTFGAGSPSAMRNAYMVKAAEMLEAAEECAATAAADTYISIAHHYMKLAELNTV